LAALFSGVGDDKDSVAILENLAGQKGADAKASDLVAGAKARLQQLVADAENALATFGPSAAILVEGARFVADRHA